MRTLRSLSNEAKLLLEIAELEIQSLCVPGHGIEEPVCTCMRCYQLNKALEKTEISPYHKYECI